MDDKIIYEVVGAVSAVSIAAGTYYFKERIKRFFRKKDAFLTEQVKDPIIEAINNDKIINEMLHSILNEFSADRTYLLQFHNGGKFYTGNSIQKLSCSHEVVNEGVKAKQHELQNVLISSIPYYLDRVINNEALFKVAEEIESYSLKALCEIHGIKSMIGIPIYNENNLIGIFGMEWVKNYADEFCETMDKNIYESFSERVQEFKIYIS